MGRVLCSIALACLVAMISCVRFVDLVDDEEGDAGGDGRDADVGPTDSDRADGDVERPDTGSDAAPDGGPVDSSIDAEVAADGDTGSDVCTDAVLRTIDAVPFHETITVTVGGEDLWQMPVVCSPGGDDVSFRVLVTRRVKIEVSPTASGVYAYGIYPEAESGEDCRLGAGGPGVCANNDGTRTPVAVSYTTFDEVESVIIVFEDTAGLAPYDVQLVVDITGAG